MKLVYCSASIYLLLYISHFLLIISCRHLKHTADKCTCAWEFKKPFIFCFITLRCIHAKINEQIIIIIHFFLSFLNHFNLPKQVISISLAISFINSLFLSRSFINSSSSFVFGTGQTANQQHIWTVWTVNLNL